jgi:hypothetical protein
MNKERNTVNIIRKAWSIVRANWRAYLIINALYYGIVIIGMIYVGFNPDVQQTLLDAVGQSFTQGPLAAVGQVYVGGQIIQAIGLTLAVNLLLGTFIEITLPSLIIPFLGLIMGIIRAVLWGLILSPASPELRMAMIPHSLTLLLEGQGYIIALLAVYVHGKAFLFPHRSGIEASGLKAHWQGYLLGLKQTAWLYVLIVLVLAVAAIYEALEVILLAPMFR